MVDNQLYKKPQVDYSEAVVEPHKEIKEKPLLCYEVVLLPRLVGMLRLLVEYLEEVLVEEEMPHLLVDSLEDNLRQILGLKDKQELLVVEVYLEVVAIITKILKVSKLSQNLLKF